MRSVLIAFSTLTLFATSPAFAGGASHVIRDDQDGPTTPAMSAGVSGGGQASYTVTLAYAPGKARVVKPAFAQSKSHVIGGDDN